MHDLFKRAVGRLGLTAERNAPLQKENVARYSLSGENPSVPPIRVAVTREGVYVRLDDVATLAGPDRVRLRNLLRMMAQENAV